MIENGRQKTNLRVEPTVMRALGRSAAKDGRSINEQAVRYLKLGLANDGFLLLEQDETPPETVKL
jgi:hypothetical protein